MRNEKAFHAPLHWKDTKKQTFGCRHTNPDICAKNSMPKVCAFVRADGMCLAPPLSWEKQFLKLKAGNAKKK
jgi:hypothetical protein